jgi:dTDP-glucose 4,6-dehydratase
MRILVAGGMGFIGSNFIRHVLAARHDLSLVNLDNLSFGSNLENLKDLSSNKRYGFFVGDINDSPLVEKLVADVSMIVNFAAQTHVDRSISDPRPFIYCNVRGTMSLLEAARKRGLKYVQISTDEVYGSAPSRKSFSELDRLAPSSPYAASKASADMLVESYHRTYGLNTVILRCTNNFGPRQFPEKFIPKAIIRAQSGSRIPIYGSGKQVRDWIYVQDFCKAIDIAMDKGRPGATYNVSAGNELINIDIAMLILKRLGKPADLIEFVADRPGHDERYSLDSSVIRSELGWKPEYWFEDAIQETIRWYSDNASWWKPLVSRKILSSTPWKEEW